MPALMRAAAPVFASAQTASPLPSVAGYQPVERLAAGRWFELLLACSAGQSEHALPDYVIKRVRDEHAGGQLPRALLQREAQVANQVSQANLISVLDVQFDETNPFIVLPYLPGRTLEEIRHSHTQTSVPQALWYIRQIAAALDSLHTAGWLHSDVKPSNVIVSSQGHATLIDLGLARRLDSAECSADRWLAGDPAYLAPESFQPQRQLTPAADIYALGLVLLQMLQGDEATENVPLNVRSTLADLRVTRPDVSRDTCSLVTKMLASEPLRRPTASELVETISRLEIESLMQW